MLSLLLNGIRNGNLVFRLGNCRNIGCTRYYIFNSPVP